MSIGKIYTKDTSARNGAGRASIIQVNQIQLLQNNRSLTAAGIIGGTTAAKVKTVNTLTYTIDGVFKSKAATDDFWTITAGVTVAVSMFQVYVFLINAAGAASMAEGVQSVAQATVVLPDLQSTLDGKACVGYATVATDATHTFIPGTTAFNAAGITTTYFDGLPTGFGPATNQQYAAAVADGQGALINTLS